MNETAFLNPEQDQSLESSLETSIANAQSFEDLLSALGSIADFPGGSKTYSRDEIISVINEARETGDISRVPRANGLRAKVGEMLESELLRN